MHRDDWSWQVYVVEERDNTVNFVTQFKYFSNFLSSQACNYVSLWNYATYILISAFTVY